LEEVRLKPMSKYTYKVDVLEKLIVILKGKLVLIAGGQAEYKWLNQYKSTSQCADERDDFPLIRWDEKWYGLLPLSASYSQIGLKGDHVNSFSVIQRMCSYVSLVSGSYCPCQFQEIDPDAQ